MVTLQVEHRSADKGLSPKALRANGLLPMAIVERGVGTKMIQAPYRAVKEALTQTRGAGSFRIALPGEKRPRQVVVKQVDRDVVSNKVQHLTLMQVSEGDLVEMEVQVVAHGVPACVDRNQATLETPTRTVKLLGRIADLPEFVRVETAALEVGATVSAGDLEMPEGVSLASSADATLFVVSPVRVKADEASSAELPEPDAEAS